MEVTMASTVESKKSKYQRFVFWLDLQFAFSSVLLLTLYTTSLVGCRYQTTGPVKQLSPEEKKAQLLKSLDRKFDDPQAQFELGQLYQSERKWSEAEWRYHRALNFDPVLWPAQAAMVKLFIDSGDPAKAKNYADMYMNKVSTSADQSLELALAFQNAGLDEYAVACFNQALSLSPNSAEIHKKFGYYYLSRNDKEKAKEHFIRSFQIDPRQPDVAGELGRLGVEVRIPQQTGQNANNQDKINK
jgi:tetratricopeptide (TPR) repeat protein